MSGLRSITGTPQTRRCVVLLLTALLMLSAVPAHAWHGHWGHRVFVPPRVVVPVVPFWPPYAYPPVVVQSPPPVVVQPPLHRHFGTIATLRRATTPMSSNALEAGGQWPPSHRSRRR
jgi:hypothetical protein